MYDVLVQFAHIEREYDSHRPSVRRYFVLFSSSCAYFFPHNPFTTCPPLSPYFFLGPPCIALVVIVYIYFYITTQDIHPSSFIWSGTFHCPFPLFHRLSMVSFSLLSPAGSNHSYLVCRSYALIANRSLFSSRRHH